MSKPVAVSAVAIAAVGLALALALEADVGLESGLWFPVIYAGTPAVAGTLVFVARRPSVERLRVTGVFLWLLVSSVGTLALAVILALGFGGGITRSPVTATLFGGLLYLGYLLVPVVLASLAARRRFATATGLLVLSPVGQGVVSVLLLVPR